MAENLLKLQMNAIENSLKALQAEKEYNFKIIDLSRNDEEQVYYRKRNKDIALIQSQLRLDKMRIKEKIFSTTTY